MLTSGAAKLGLKPFGVAPVTRPCRPGAIMYGCLAERERGGGKEEDKHIQTIAAAAAAAIASLRNKKKVRSEGKQSVCACLCCSNKAALQPWFWLVCCWFFTCMGMYMVGS